MALLLLGLLGTLAVQGVAVPDLAAQSKRGPFGRFGPAQGLSNPSVHAVWQDAEGFMWFGTEDGLNRFDGSRFEVYRHDPADSLSLSESWILSVAEDTSGDLWIGTRNRGLNRLDLDTRTVTRYPFDPPEGQEGLRHGTVRTLLRSGQTLWIGMMGGGISRLDLPTGTYTHYDRRDPEHAALKSNDVWCLLQDRAGFLWLGKWETGLTRFDPRTGSFVQYEYDRADSSSLSSNRVRALFEDREGFLWVATSGGGLNRFDRRTGRFKRFLHDPADPTSISHNVVWSIFEDSRGNIWVGTHGGGLNRFDRGTETFTHFRHDPNDPTSLPSDVILSIYEDRSGLLWFATDSGMATYNPISERIKHFSHDPADPATLSNSDVLSVVRSAREPGTFWIGTNRGGVNRLDLERGRVERVFTGEGVEQEGLVVSAVAEDSTGVLWIGTMGGGLIAHDRRSGRTRHFRHDPADPTSLSENAILALLVGADNTLWVGTDSRGLNRLDRDTGTFTRYPVNRSDASGLSDRGVLTLHQGSDGAIWIGTGTGGLNRLDPATGRFTHYHANDDATSLSHERIYAIYEREPGVLWIGTYGGLNRLDLATERFKQYTMQDGLASSVIFGIVGGRDGMLWLTTNRGLSRLNPRTDEIINYGVADGLPSARFNRGAVARSDRGEILLGGPNGLDVFHPSILQHKKYRPTLVVTSFKKFGTLVESDLDEQAVLRLSHDDAYFSFEFAMLDFTNPSEHTFRYRLEGFDSEWQQVDGPIGSAHYRIRDGQFGSFVFQVQGTDSKGRTSERRLLVTIVPPWWRTPWFRALCLAGSLILAGAALAYGYRRKRLELIEKGRMLAEGREQERHFLARELHDVPLQNLYSVRHRLEVLAREVEFDGHAQDLELTRQLLEQTAEDLRRICGELRPPALGPFGLSRAIRSHLRGFEESYPDIVVEFDLMPDGQRLPESIRLALFRIYQGALSNVARHAQARHVWIRFRVNDDEVVLEVQDDGCGFVVPKNWLELARQQHYGLLGISEWVTSIGGVLAVRSAPGEGALLQVRVPLQASERPRRRPAAAEPVPVHAELN